MLWARLKKSQNRYFFRDFQQQYWWKSESWSISVSTSRSILRNRVAKIFENTSQNRKLMWQTSFVIYMQICLYGTILHILTYVLTKFMKVGERSKNYSIFKRMERYKQPFDRPSWNSLNPNFISNLMSKVSFFLISFSESVKRF